MKQGEAFRFYYLWAHEAERGEDGGRKSRRVCLLLENAGHLYLFPISSKLPVSTTDQSARVFLELPETERVRIGLFDASKSYLILDDYNKVALDGLQDFVSVRPTGSFSHRFLALAARRFLDAYREGRVSGPTSRLR